MLSVFTAASIALLHLRMSLPPLQLPAIPSKQPCLWRGDHAGHQFVAATEHQDGGTEAFQEAIPLCLDGWNSHPNVGKTVESVENHPSGNG